MEPDVEAQVLHRAIGGSCWMAHDPSAPDLAKLLRVGASCRGYYSDELRFDVDSRGIVITTPAAVTIPWRRVADVFIAGWSAEDVDAWRQAYRRYCDLAAVHAIDWLEGVDDYYRLYGAATDEMRAAERRVLERGMAAKAAPQLSLFGD